MSSRLTHIFLLILLGLRISVFFQKPTQRLPINTPQSTSNTVITGALNDSGFQTQLEQTTQQQSQALLDVSKISVQELSKMQKESAQTSSIQALKKIYETTKDPKVLSLLLQKLITDFQYDEAYELAQKGSGAGLTQNEYLDLLFNSSQLNANNPSSLERIKTLLNQERLASKLTENQFQWYHLLIDAAVLNTTGVYEKAKNNADANRLPIIKELQSNQTYVLSKKDLPTNYLNALNALTFLRFGYYKLAQQMSAQIVQSAPNYILPHQILAYSHFVMNNREPALQYLLKLLDIDATNTQKYKLMLGIAYYRSDKSDLSILYLNQVNDNQLIIDAHRYLILAYQKRQDFNKLSFQYQQLLGMSGLNQNDFFSFFQTAFFRPLNTASPITFGERYENTATLYLTQCYQLLPEAQQAVCSYGKAGNLINQGRRDEAAQYLYYSAKHFPSSSIFEALGDYYLTKQQVEKAKGFYIKALLLSTENTDQNKLKQKLVTTETKSN